jgi:hypothetical protein
MSMDRSLNKLRQMHRTGKPATSSVASKEPEVQRDGGRIARWRGFPQTALCDRTVTVPAAPQPRSAPACVMCGEPASGRSRYCSPACRQRAYRLRQQPDQQTLLEATTASLKQQQALVEHTVYLCSRCERRLLGEWRCPDCGLMCKKLGLGGPCPHCDELVVLVDLLDGAGW